LNSWRFTVDSWKFCVNKSHQINNNLTKQKSFSKAKQKRDAPFPASVATVLVSPTADLPNNNNLNGTIVGVIPDGNPGCSNSPVRK
jgi:hypothetical protein